MPRLKPEKFDNVWFALEDNVADAINMTTLATVSKRARIQILLQCRATPRGARSATEW